MGMGNRLLLLACLLAAAGAQAVDVYRWKDAKGHMVYSDTPPPGRSATKLILQAGAPPVAADASAPAGKPPMDGQAINAKAKEQNKRIMDTNCRTARENLGMVNKPLPPGAAPSASRDESIRRAQEDVKTWCQP
ncbi:DUF4124 domain-containing protein [Vogesella sp. LIG4]|uniref:DUF4124 domain-containing protein n=1 Tax=Vogesella sp. LIG4 TaxID=1192162 RepID=UPI00081FC079|nr:DUF4124 domain-containing protein [Vogesella sp. LIG4]SCK21962.1 protein of unknown function [Vogesella sp. LIG4]